MNVNPHVCLNIIPNFFLHCHLPSCPFFLGGPLTIVTYVYAVKKSTNSSKLIQTSSIHVQHAVVNAPRC
jgi:hypothetical protein